MTGLQDSGVLKAKWSEKEQDSCLLRYDFTTESQYEKIMAFIAYLSYVRNNVMKIYHKIFICLISLNGLSIFNQAHALSCT